MLVENTNLTNNFSNTKIKENTLSSDEFQASLNAIKKKEKKENEKQTSFQNTDLDMGRINADFKSYAWEKLRESQYKKNEEGILNKLFATIDAINYSK